MSKLHQRTSNLEVLRGIIDVQEENIHKLVSQVGTLRAEVAQLKGEPADDAVQQKLEELVTQLSALKQLHFGDSSEKLGRPGDGDADSNEGKGKEKEAKPRTGHGPREQPLLPHIIKEHDLDEADKICNCCGGNLVPMGDQSEDSQQITVIDCSYALVTHKRKKYRCACQGSIEVALGEAPIIPGGRYSVPFAIHVVVNKFCDHIPLTRQVRMMGRAGLKIDDTTLFDQVVTVAGYAKRTVEALKAWILSQSVLHADETRWKYLQKKKSKSWWLWAICNSMVAVFELKPGRGREHADALLEDYRGIVIADGYGVYDSLCRNQKKHTGSSFTLAQCWAHARRYFIKARKSDKKKSDPFLDLIKQLYQVEAEAKALAKAAGQLSEAEYAALLHSHRARLRDEKSRDLVDRFFKLIATTPALPTSALGKAIAYADGRKAGLSVFLDHPVVEIDNNPVERRVRGPVVGRKNFYGTASKRGAEVTAILYSIIETAHLYGIDPAAWLRAIVRAAQADPNAVLMPWDFAGRPAPA